jgi:dethiobiotin synthetase
MPTLFVTATGTDVGKTHVACALIQALRAADRPVDAFKPVLSGFDGPDGSDAARLLEALGQPLSALDRMSPLRFAAPLAPPSAARQEARWLELADLTGLCLARMDTTDLLLIEGAGGIMSPLAEGATNLDLADNLRAPILLVTGSYLGAVSHTLTAIEVIRARGLTIAAIVVSESPGEAPDLSEITTALAEFAPDLPVVTAPRAEVWDASPLLPFVTV